VGRFGSLSSLKILRTHISQLESEAKQSDIDRFEAAAGGA
jgi:hypothetical protein